MQDRTYGCDADQGFSGVNGTIPHDGHKWNTQRPLEGERLGALRATLEGVVRGLTKRR